MSAYDDSLGSVRPRKPEWLRISLPSGAGVRRVEETLGRHGLHTVCDEAHCPNKAECWGQSTATFMIMGAVCTRGCRFCAVATARQGEALRPTEPSELAEAVADLALRYAVVTSVDRDDLPDRGAAHFAASVRAIRDRNPGIRIEVLAPDYQAGEIEVLLEAGPDVFAHNIESVRRLQSVRDARASWETSLATLNLASAWSKERGGRPRIKSSILLGLGETREELLQTMDALRGAGVTSLVLGQYLRPGPRQLEVVEYIHPEVFAAYAKEARDRGFSAVVSSPLARTSYHARSSFDTAGDGGDSNCPEESE
jgi:lipoic acid synthetase